MVSLSKTERIMKRLLVTPKTATFVIRNEDTNYIESEVSIPNGLYNDLGCPALLTVTIKPGDHLN